MDLVLQILEYVMMGSAILMIICILLQQRGATLGAGFGASGELYTTRRGVDKSLFEFTIVMAVVFVLSIIVGLLLPSIGQCEMSQKPVKRWNRFQNLHSTSELVQRARQAQTATREHTKTFFFSRLSSVKRVRRAMAAWFILVGTLLFLVWLQFAVLQNTYSTTATEPGGTYAEGVVGEIGSVNPLYTSGPAEQSLSRLMFSSLFDYDNEGYLRSDLATGYDVGDEGKTYTVTLREDAFWSDGQQIDADDIVFTVEVMKDPGAGAVLGNTWREVTAEKVDNRTVKFEIPAAYAPFPHALTFPVVPEHILSSIQPSQLRESDFSTSPVTSGPFKYRDTQYVSGLDGSSRAVIVMERNDDYYSDAPRLNRFQLHSYPNSEALANGLRTREINAASNLSMQDVKDFKERSNYKTDTSTVRAGVYALFNTTGTVLKDRDLRKALQIGTDVERVVDAVSEDLNVLNSPYIPTSQIPASAEKPKYDLAEAKRILDEAGWKPQDGKVRVKDNVALSIRVVSLKDPDYEKLVESLSSQWKELGFRVETEVIDPNDPTQSMTSGVLQPRNYDVLVHELTIGADPDVYAYWHSSQATARGLNFTNYSSNIADESLVSARSRADQDLRAVKYEAFYEQWLKDAPAIGLYQSVVSYATNRSTTAFAPDANYITHVGRYYNVSEWAVRQADAYTTPQSIYTPVYL